MINFIDRALERFLREQVPLPESSIGVSFDTPDKAWGAALNRPTVNVFLWDLSRSPAAARTGIDERRGEVGVQRRVVNPSVDFNYLLTAWATEVRDEHQLLGNILQAVMAGGQLAGSDFPDGVLEGRARITVASAEERVPGEFWSALGGRLKPGLQLKVTATLPVHAWETAAAPPTSIEVGVEASTPPAPAPVPATARWMATEPSTPRRLKRTGVVSTETRAPRPD